MVPRWAPPAGLGLLSRALLRAAEPRAARALSDKAAAGPHPDREGLLACKRVVIKVGTAVVSNPNGTLVGPRAWAWAWARAWAWAWATTGAARVAKAHPLATMKRR